MAPQTPVWGVSRLLGPPEKSARRIPGGALVIYVCPDWAECKARTQYFLPALAGQG